METENSFLEALRDWKENGNSPNEIIFSEISNCINFFVQKLENTFRFNKRDALTKEFYVTELEEKFWSEKLENGGFKYLLNLNSDELVRNQIFSMIDQLNSKIFLEKNPARKKQKDIIDLTIENIPFFEKIDKGRYGKYIKLKSGTTLEVIFSYIENSNMKLKEHRKNNANEIFEFLRNQKNQTAKLNDLYRELISVNELSFSSIEKFISENTASTDNNQYNQTNDNSENNKETTSNSASADDEINIDALVDHESENIEASDYSSDRINERAENSDNISSNNVEENLYKQFLAKLNSVEQDLFMIHLYSHHARNYVADLNRNAENQFEYEKIRTLKNNPLSLNWYVENEPDRFPKAKSATNELNAKVQNKFKEFHLKLRENNYNNNEIELFVNYTMEKVIEYFGGYDD